jgi:hypothetical protein
LGAVLVAVALWLVVRRTDAVERRGAAIAAGLSAPVLLGPLVVSLVGPDYLISRYVVTGWILFAIVLAAGLAARAAGATGVVALGALCALSLTLALVLAATPTAQRPDWRAAAELLGPATSDRVIVAPGFYLPSPLEVVYLESARRVPGGRRLRVSEIDVITLEARFQRRAREWSSSGEGCWWGAACQLPALARSKHPPARYFRLAERRDGGGFTLTRYRSARTRLVNSSELVLAPPGEFRVLAQSAPRRSGSARSRFRGSPGDLPAIAPDPQ